LWVDALFAFGKLSAAVAGVYTPQECSCMEPVTVAIREFRGNLAAYLLESQGSMAITRHGDTIGYDIPARRKRTEAERAALDPNIPIRAALNSKLSPLRWRGL
jgi:hypothetical protein